MNQTRFCFCPICLQMSRRMLLQLYFTNTLGSKRSELYLEKTISHLQNMPLLRKLLLLKMYWMGSKSLLRIQWLLGLPIGSLAWSIAY